MRASTLFVLTIAVLVGLGAIAAVRYTGWFTKTPPPPVVVEAPIKVVVARENLFEGMTIQAKDVVLRDLSPAEAEYYKQNKDKYLPPVTEAATLRILTTNVEAGKPLLREYLQDLGIPPALNQRLAPNMRAVNISLFKDRAAGGLIQVGEHVDVYLTTVVGRGGKWDEAATLTARIAKDLKVIAKRDTLWTGLAAIPENRPVHFTLEANPYRAALIEFAKQKGLFALAPTSSPRNGKGGRPGAVRPASLSDPESKEFRDEDKRVAAFLSGELAVGEPDLVRIFNLKPPLPVTPPIVVERVTGVDPQKSVVFQPKDSQGMVDGSPNSPHLDRPRMGYQFRSPEAGRSTEGGRANEAGQAVEQSSGEQAERNSKVGS
jgi:Flp pilus assembly protein CpaB